MWSVVLIGAFLTISVTYLLKMQRIVHFANGIFRHVYWVGRVRHHQSRPTVERAARD
jgi:hypothetical protein